MKKLFDACVVAGALEGWLAAIILASQGREVCLLQLEDMELIPPSIPLQAFLKLQEIIKTPEPLFTRDDVFEERENFIDCVIGEARFPLIPQDGALEAYLQETRWTRSQTARIKKELHMAISNLSPVVEEGTKSSMLPESSFKRVKPLGREVHVWLREIAEFHRVKISKARLKIHEFFENPKRAAKADAFYTDILFSPFQTTERKKGIFHFQLHLKKPLPCSVSRIILIGSVPGIVSCLLSFYPQRTFARGIMLKDMSQQEAARSLELIFKEFGASVENVKFLQNPLPQKEASAVFKTMTRKKITYVGPKKGEDIFTGEALFRELGR